jgi:carbon monoxide dehydrogenase subunit G
MDISGSYTFDAPPERVWALLMDPVALAACVPGCDRLEPAGEDRYTAALTVGLAAITGKYTGTVAVVDKNEPHSYRLVVEGQGRAGFVNGNSAIALRPDGAATIVDVNATVQMGGTIARLGQRLVGGAARMMMDQFFSCLQARVAAPHN